MTGTTHNAIVLLAAFLWAVVRSGRFWTLTDAADLDFERSHRLRSLPTCSLQRSNPISSGSADIIVSFLFLPWRHVPCRAIHRLRAGPPRSGPAAHAPPDRPLAELS